MIGVMLGTQLVSQVEGVRGWGVPSEMIFEVRDRDSESRLRSADGVLATHTGRCLVCLGWL